MQYTFWGKVQHGAKRGRELGYPTANMKLHTKIPEGIYISKVKVNNIVHFAVTFIGNAKTFGEKDYKAESFILTFNSQIYGQWITVNLIKKIRNNEKFDSKKSLINQIEKDILATRKFFNKIK